MNKRPPEAPSAAEADGDATPAVTLLNARSREVLRLLVETYMTTGEPVGSRTLSKAQGLNLSPASIRNVMADLQESGLLYSPHTSAGRLPTDAGLRLFVNGLLEVGAMTEEERRGIEAMCQASGRSFEEALGATVGALSGLSHCASLVLAPKSERPLKHIEFVRLSENSTLVVMVFEKGMVENRVFETPSGLPASALVEAGNYLTRKLAGRTLSEARRIIREEIESHRHQLDGLASDLVERGLAHWSGGDLREGVLIVRGQANLLENITALEELERVRELFQMLEEKESMVRLLDLTNDADGVQVFIGAENTLFGHAGCAMIVAPFANSKERIIGAIGVVGPTRMNYARIVPMVDYTSRLIGRLIG